MKWYIAIYENAKTHYFPEILKDAILTNLENRGCTLYRDFPGGNLKEVREIGLSLMQPCMTDTSWMPHLLPGVVFNTETREMEFFLDEIKNSPIRLELGTPYYKIHGKFHCVCLIEEHRNMLIKSMEEKLEEARAITELENRLFNERLKEAQTSFVNLSERPVHENLVKA